MFRKRHCQSSEADPLRPCTRSSGGACGREHRDTLADPCTVFAVPGTYSMFYVYELTESLEKS